MIEQNVFGSNWLLVEFVYSFVIMTAAAAVVFKTDKWHELSGHEGIRYFRDAFVYFSIGAFFHFVGQYLLNANIGIDASLLSILIMCKHVLIVYVISMASFMLVLSLVWKNFDTQCLKREYALHGVAFIIALLDVLVGYYIHFVAMIGVLLYAIILSHQNYCNHKKCNLMSCLYFVIVCLTLLLYVLNVVVRLLMPAHPNLVCYLYITNAIVFVGFTMAVCRVGSKW